MLRTAAAPAAVSSDPRTPLSRWCRTRSTAAGGNPRSSSSPDSSDIPSHPRRLGEEGAAGFAGAAGEVGAVREAGARVAEAGEPVGGRLAEPRIGADRLG